MHCLKKLLSLPILAALAMSLVSCASVTPQVQPLVAERPREEAFRTELKKELSTLNIAMEATAGELGDTLSRLIPRELYKGSTKTRGLAADIVRSGPITVGAADNFVHLSVPISISLSYGIFETPAIATKLTFKLAPRVTPDWRVITEVSYTGLSDQLVETLGIGPLTIKPRSIVDGLTEPVQRKLSELVGQKLNEKFPLRAEVAKIWNLAQKPILLDKNYNAWLKLIPREVMLYPFSARSNRVSLNVGLKAYAEVVVGPQPPAGTPLPLPNLKMINGVDHTFRVALNTDLFYKDILAIATPRLLGRELGSDGKSFILKELDLYGNGDRLIVKLSAIGTFEGTIYLVGKPVFDPRSGRFSVEEVDFDFQTASLLHQSADWLLHGSIRSTIQEKLNLDLNQRLTKAKELADKSLARVRLADNVFLSGSVRTVTLNDVLVQKDKLSIQVYAEGETAILLH